MFYEYHRNKFIKVDAIKFVLINKATNISGKTVYYITMQDNDLGEIRLLETHDIEQAEETLQLIIDAIKKAGRDE
jgi:hypothetical protein